MPEPCNVEVGTAEELAQLVKLLSQQATKHPAVLNWVRVAVGLLVTIIAGAAIVGFRYGGAIVRLEQMDSKWPKMEEAILSMNNLATEFKGYKDLQERTQALKEKAESEEKKRMWEEIELLKRSRGWR